MVETMSKVKGVYQNGRIELLEPVDWPDGTRVEVTLIATDTSRVVWPSLPPLDVGAFREFTPDDDILGEMLEGKSF